MDGWKNWDTKVGNLCTADGAEFCELLPNGGKAADYSTKPRNSSLSYGWLTSWRFDEILTARTAKHRAGTESTVNDIRRETGND